MSRTIPISLQDHLDSGTTTLCGLIRIAPVRPGYGVVGITTLDRDVVYDDGDGPITYYAAVGYTASNYVGTADFTVDNAETTSLLPEFDIPQLTEADITSGAYDYADYKMMLVNYEDLTQGHILYSTGTMGEAKVVDGLSFLGELRSLFQRYRQSIVERDSLTCRATFGSQAADSSNASNATKIERFPCGVVVDSFWFSGAVTQVGIESTVAFASTDVVVPSGSFVPGMVEWLTGANAGRQNEVSEHEFDSEGSVFSLAFPTAFPIQDGDTFRVRPDCTKQWGGFNSCGTYNNRLNFRGEPFIPVGDAGSTSNPGSATNPGLTGGQQGEVQENYAPENPSVPVMLDNPDFEGSGGWTTVVSQSGQTFTITAGVGRFTLDGVNPGPITDPFFGDSMQVANTASAKIANPGFFEASVEVRCTAFAGDSSDEWQCGVILEEYSDAGLTTLIGRAEQFPIRTNQTTGYNRITTRMVAGAYVRMVVRAVSTAAATIEINNATWDLKTQP
jgi:uncharacterized phage protein (TIGR02218 family)